MEYIDGDIVADGDATKLAAGTIFAFVPPCLPTYSSLASVAELIVRMVNDWLTELNGGTKNGNNNNSSPSVK